MLNFNTILALVAVAYIISLIWVIRNPGTTHHAGGKK